MVTRPFTYLAPGTLQEACALAKEHGGDAKFLAGGQSLLPILKLNLTTVSYIIDLKRIPELSFIRSERADGGPDDDHLAVGALTTHAELSTSALVKRLVPLLSETAAGIGHPLVRNRGTIGGSLSHCDPAADLCVTALALDATVTVARPDGSRREVRAADFFTGMFTTALQEGEILEKVSFPIQGAGSGYAFEKLTLGHGDFPLLVVSVLLSVEDGRCASIAIATGGTADFAVRMAEAEALLRGKQDLSPADIEGAADRAAASSHPSTDLEVSAAYKKRMVKVLVRRALSRSLDMSRSGGALA